MINLYYFIIQRECISGKNITIKPDKIKMYFLKFKNSLIQTANSLFCGFTILLLTLIISCSSNEFAILLENPYQNRNPVPGGNGTLNIAAGKILWTKSTDDLTPEAELQYIVYRSLGESASISGPGLPSGGMFLDWTANISQCLITSGGGYYYNVFVKDTNGAVSAYTPKIDTLPGGNVPTAGTINDIPVVSNKKVTISWTAATDTETPQALLLYAVYSSENAAYIATYEDAITSAVNNISWTANITIGVSHMSKKTTTYWFNVFVQDESGNITPYETVSATTE